MRGVRAAVAGYGLGDYAHTHTHTITHTHTCSLGDYAGIFRRPGAGGEASEAAARAPTPLSRHVSARASSESCSESRPDIRSATRLKGGGPSRGHPYR